MRLFFWRGKLYGEFLLLLSKTCQDPVDDVLVLNASDDFDGPRIRYPSPVLRPFC